VAYARVVRFILHARLPIKVKLMREIPERTALLYRPSSTNLKHFTLRRPGAGLGLNGGPGRKSLLGQDSNLKIFQTFLKNFPANE